MASRLPYQPLPLDIADGQILQHQDEDRVHLWEVLTGALAERIRDPEGRSLVLDVVGPGDITGYVPGRTAPWEVHALGSASLRRWSGSPDAVSERWAVRLGSLAGDLAWLDVRERLARRLDQLAARFGTSVPGGVRITVPLTHEDLAACIGTSRESVSRAMADLRNEGTVDTSGRGRIVVRSPLHLVQPER